MKPVILFGNIQNYSDEDYSDFYHSLYKLRKNKVDKLQQRDDQKRSILAGHLILTYLQKIKRLELIEQIQISFNGKEVFPIQSNLYFSISHSGDYVMVVFYHHPIGCDIQKITNKGLDIANQFFNIEEAEIIKNSDHLAKTFCEFWTIKESYLKAIGQGLKKPLNSAHVFKNKKRYFLMDKSYKCHIVKSLDQDYICAIVYSLSGY